MSPDPGPAPIPAPTSRRAALAIAIVGGLALVLFAAIASAVDKPKQGPAPGQPAPRFTLLTFDGQAVALDDLRGNVVVLNFWASWCVPCADEAADLEALWQRFKDRDVRFVGVDYVDTEGPARAYLTKHAVTYPNGPDLGGRISGHYRVMGVPETFIIDRDGRIVSPTPPGAEPRDRLALPLTDAAAFKPSDLAALIERLLGPDASSDAGPGRMRPRVRR